MWKKFVTSGMAIDPSHIDYRKLYLTNTLLLTAAVVFSVFALVTSCISKQYLIALVDLAGAVVAVGTILYLRRTGRLYRSSAILVGMVFVLTLCSIYFDTYPNMNLAWVYVIPLTAFFLLERKVGLWVVIAYGILYGVILWSRFDTVEMVNKGPVLFANIFGVLIVVTALTRYFEVSRKEAQHHLKKALAREAAQSRVLQNALSELTEYRNKLEKRVEEDREELSLKENMLLQQAKMVSMGEMVAMIAHQLKQPLNLVSVVTHDARESFRCGELDQERIEQLSNKTLNSVRFMSDTIDTFKNFLKPNKNKKIFSLKESIDKALEIVTAPLQNDQVRITLEGHDALLYGVESEMQQVVMNLLINARDAMVQQNVQERLIGITLEDRGGSVDLVVRDNAGGIPEEIIGSLFGSFVSSKGEEGMGLGLYMVKMIVESYDGSVRVENRDGGACFTITLPKAVPTA